MNLFISVDLRFFLKQLPEVARSVGIKLYPAIRTWQHLNNSAIFGLPLKRIRAADPVVKIFSAIANDLEKIFLHKRSLIHHLHREDLNSLDRIEAIISQIEGEVNLDIAPEEIEAADGDRSVLTSSPP